MIVVYLMCNIYVESVMKIVYLMSSLHQQF